MSRARHRIRREGRRARASENRSRPCGLGTRAGPREGLSVGIRSDSGRILRPAEHLRVRADEGRTEHVSEIPGLLPMAGEDGGTSDRAKASRRIAAARSHRARAAVGGFASAQILIRRYGIRMQGKMEDRMKWITREHVKVDRVACPWLIKKFVDRDEEFIFVPADKVVDEAKRLNAILYDVKNVELGHHGKECSFEAILKKYKLRDDPALVLLARSSTVPTPTIRSISNPKRRASKRSRKVSAIWASRTITR